ncbi:MAG: prefoldin subunit beta [Thermoplasmatales archaeon B_DKE]|nr:MAG: prefoldin subunit beta [Thermoplasmatales archaeon B_DKE]QRF76353.1 GimC subunit beta [Thermoplasmatales archaeon]
MEPNLSEYLQNQIKQAQQLEGQIEQVATQKYQLDVRIKELDKTIKELDSIKDGTKVFKNVGPVLYEVESRKKLIDELSEQKELSEIRIKTLEKQQASLEAKYKELEEILKKRYEEARKGQK